MKYRVDKEEPLTKGKIMRDQIISLTAPDSQKNYPKQLRLIEAVVTINGEEVTMSFITNNLEWSALSICDLYKARWAIEVFFKQLKQTLQLSDFLGYSKNAVLWQIWMALLCYVLLRFIAFQSKWTGSFPRILTLLRGVLWNRLKIDSVISCCGTAPKQSRLIGTPHQAYLPGFAF